MGRGLRPPRAHRRRDHRHQRAGRHLRRPSRSGRGPCPRACGDRDRERALAVGGARLGVLQRQRGRKRELRGDRYRRARVLGPADRVSPSVPLPVSRILLVDDDATGRRVAVHNLRRAGLEVDDAEDGAAALAAFDPGVHAVVVTDLKMPGVDGMTLLATVHARAPGVPVIVITAFGDVEKAVEAMRAGAWDFIEKPFAREKLELAVRRALEASSLRRENARLRQGVERPIVAESQVMTDVLRLVDRAAPRPLPVLITGESGVGKELIARRLHARSGRSGAFVAVNCAALPAELLESELFGHTRGAFTGASKPREGRFRRADRGTLFLDEIGELPAALQSKLLRVLEEGAVDVVGADEPVSVDVRVVAATNQDVDAQIAEGSLREDLFFRLAAVRVEVPPLRARKADIQPLAERFLAESGVDLPIGPELADELRRRPWPGNVRELRNAVERLVMLSDGELSVADLPSARALRTGGESWLEAIPEELSLVDVEAQVIAHALARHEGNVSAAARALRVPRHILVYRIQKYGLG
ncbi:MAG: sigma-54-dependent Fis family transcriptional regulator [Deltaproteobacteria bacterium]|nr:MAG: sigma-54-dependent Fis family transcriptional regulator [Deltaproteobacteria bacterium]